MSFGDRCRWLSHPAFIAAVLALALNDHVLKASFPGWWTGKLSDVAGLFVIGSIAAVVLGPRGGPVLAGIAFVLLKTVPGVSELVAPALGGPTTRDSADLLALSILIPLYACLRGASGEGLGAARVRGADRARRARRGISAAAPLVWATIALITATATSCAPGPAVTHVAADSDSLYAFVDEGWEDGGWARSGDGGISWSASEAPRGVPSPAARSPFVDPGPTGPQEVCVDDGTCWRLRDRRTIEVRYPGGQWVQEHRITESEFDEVSTGCQGAQVGVLSSLAATERSADPMVVASYGAEGALRRERDGRWVEVRVLSAPPVEASAIERASSSVTLGFGPVLAILMLLIGRRRWPSWRKGLVVIAVGWLTTIMAAGAISFWVGTDTDPAIIIGRATIAGVLVTTVAAVVTARRPLSAVERYVIVPDRPDRS